MQKLYLDSETCGLCSMPVLFQWALDHGVITIYDIWLRPVRETLNTIESFLEHYVVGFNLTFDWFQVCKLYCVWRLLPLDWIPIEHINEIAALEERAKDGPCIKPAGALDLLLHSRKGPYQSLMARDDIRIRRVPTVLAYALRDELEQRVKIDDIYFAKSADKDAPRWHVLDVRKNGVVQEHLKDVVLHFKPAGGLKFLAEHALGRVPKYHYTDVEPPEEWRPVEFGYAPTAMAVSSPERHWKVWNFNPKRRTYDHVGFAWPGVIEKFVEHWHTRKDAREYANDDIIYTRDLDEHFGYPEVSDDDSILACMVGAVRWHGFAIDKPALNKLRVKAQAKVSASPINTNKAAEIRAYLRPFLDDTEATKLDVSTNKQTLKEYKNFVVLEDEVCLVCNGQGCQRCDKGILRQGKHPVADRADEVIKIKAAKKEIEQIDKLLLAGRFHTDLIIIGTRSSRMSGSGGLNAQGIKSAEEFRACFPLAWEYMKLCGGDFDSFEVTLAEAVYHDEELRKTLTTWKECHKCSGKGCDECEGEGQVTVKIHAAFAMELFGKTYEEVMASKEMYGTGKAAIFAMTYGGDWSTLKRKNNIPEEIAKRAYEGFLKRYPGIARARQKTFDKFCSMRQPGGEATQIYWAEPDDYVETFLGFRRYFTLENQICRILVSLAEKPPKGWRQVRIPVIRAYSGRVQTACGALASALYGAAFGIQSANMRAAANHEIQSPGGQITKHVQRLIWDHQPVGVHPFKVAPLNVHDELMVATDPEYVPLVTATVRAAVEGYREQVPLIGMTWFEGIANWSEKKVSGSPPVKIRCKEMLEPPQRKTA
jgi:hypothetical protein